jgi:hypothetical protein
MLAKNVLVAGFAVVVIIATVLMLAGLTDRSRE